MADIINVTPRQIESIPLSYRQIGNLAVCAWCGERAKSAYAITDPRARAVFNIGNCGRSACAEEAAKVRTRVAVHQRIVDLT
jgi:hypothetical protein